MIQCIQKQIIPNYIDPIANHPVVRHVFTGLVEVIKIIAAKLFLEFLGRRYLLQVPAGQIKEHLRLVHNATVFAPIAEEIFFRLFVMKGIHLMQAYWNRYKNDEVTEEAAMWQKTFRVELSALIFAAAHLTNHKHTADALFQCTWSYFGGVTYGYLTEKYQTLSVSILAHGFNNSLALAGSKIYSQFAHFFIVAIVVHKCAAYVLATTTIDTKIYAGIGQMAHYCADLPGRCRRWFSGSGKVGISVV